MEFLLTVERAMVINDDSLDLPPKILSQNPKQPINDDSLDSYSKALSQYFEVSGNQASTNQ